MGKLYSLEQVLTDFPLLHDESLSLLNKRYFKVRGDVTMKKNIADLVYDIVPDAEPSCLLITERGIWPSSENVFLVDRLVECWLADATGLSACGLMFEAGELEWARSFLFLSLANIWGFRFSSVSGKVVLEVDHHEEMTILSADENTLNELKQNLSHLGIFALEQLH